MARRARRTAASSGPADLAQERSPIPRAVGSHLCLQIILAAPKIAGDMTLRPLYSRGSHKSSSPITNYDVRTASCVEYV